MKTTKRNCPICNSYNSTIIFSDYNRREGYKELTADFVKCSGCGMKFLTNVPDFDDLKGKYEDIYTSVNFKICEPKNNINKNILDIGCNYGQQLKSYYEKGFDCYGIDLNKKAIVDAKKNLPNGEFEVCIIEDFKPSICTFDVIRTSHVLEHVYNIDSFLKSVLKLLKPGGVFEIYIPNGNSLEFRLFNKYSAQSWIPFHLNLFDKNNLIKKLRMIGFEVVKAGTNTIPFYWLLSFRQLIGNVNKARGVTNSEINFINKLFIILIYPFTLVLSKLGFGEELYVIATKK